VESQLFPVGFWVQDLDSGVEDTLTGPRSRLMVGTKKRPQRVFSNFEKCRSALERKRSEALAHGTRVTPADTGADDAATAVGGVAGDHRPGGRLGSG
jgi:hypothetical protein